MRRRLSRRAKISGTVLSRCVCLTDGFASVGTECRVQFDGLKHFGSSDKYRACAQHKKHFPDRAGILDHILLTPLNRTKPKCVGDEEYLQLGLDGEEAKDAFHS